MMNLLRENTTAVNMTMYSINKAEHVNTKQKQKQKQKLIEKEKQIAVDHY